MQESSRIQMFMESLSDLAEDDTMNVRAKTFAFSVLLGSYYEVIPEEALELLFEEAGFDLDDRETQDYLRGTVNVCHFNNIYRISPVEEGSIIDPENPLTFMSLMDEENASYVEMIRSGVLQSRKILSGIE